MLSYTTQSHQRNYQGNTVVENPNHIHAKNKRHQRLNVLITLIMATAIIITGSMLGTTALHNQQLKTEIQVLSLQNQPETTDKTTTDNITPNANHEKPRHHHHKKHTLHEIPISEKQHEARSLPSVSNQKLN